MFPVLQSFAFDNFQLKHPVRMKTILTIFVITSTELTLSSNKLAPISCSSLLISEIGLAENSK